MMNLVGYPDLPVPIRNQIYRVVGVWKKYLKDELVGVYLHGSIVLNAFHPQSGDIDILAVVKNPLDIQTKLSLAKEILAIDKKPCPLEMSAILCSDAKRWITPGNCVFHYSDFWTEKLQKKLRDPDAECYVVDQEFPDADVTSYIKLIRQCGIVLYGEEIADVFCDISDGDFWMAICGDIDEYDFHAYNPRYLASNILILGRILSFKKEQRILSKYDAGLWMIENLPAEFVDLPGLAMKIWYEDEQHELPEADLNRLKTYLVEEIKR